MLGGIKQEVQKWTVYKELFFIMTLSYITDSGSPSAISEPNFLASPSTNENSKQKWMQSSISLTKTERLSVISSTSCQASTACANRRRVPLPSSGQLQNCTGEARTRTWLFRGAGASLSRAGMETTLRFYKCDENLCWWNHLRPLMWKSYCKRPMYTACTTFMISYIYPLLKDRTKKCFSHSIFSQFQWW